MIRSIIIDDELDARKALRLVLERFCPEVELLGEADSAETGKALILDSRPELVFLDIQMPHRSGFELLEELETIDFEVIFVTAHDHYAIKAIRFSALDYLLKPIDLDDLQAAIRRVRKNPSKETAEPRLRHLLHNHRGGAEAFKKLAIPSQEGTLFLPVEHIIYCEAEGNYTRVHLAESKGPLVSRPLKELESMLEHSGFFRVHHSFLINLQHIQKYVRGEGGYVILSGNRHIDVSRRKKEDFLRKLGMH